MGIVTKKISGKEYKYLEHSFRLPDGSLKKISKYITRDPSEAEEYIKQKKVEAFEKWALGSYKTGPIFTAEQIKKIEGIRIGYKDIMQKLTKKQIDDVLDRFALNFTYETNAIEGNSLTLKDVTIVIKENIVPKNTELRDVYETRNTREAIGLVFSEKLDISVKDIIRLHEIIVRDTGVSTGFKKFPNFLLMRDVKTTRPEKVNAEMNKLIKNYNKGKVHPVKLAADFHALFEQIHPFEDGNGRVGRALVNMILIENGLPPIIIRKSSKVAYFSALEAYDKGHTDKLYRFFLEKFKKTYRKFFEVYVKYI